MSSEISPEQFAHDVVIALIASGRTNSSNPTASGLMFDLNHLETSVGALVKLEKLIADAYRNSGDPKPPMKISPDLLSKA